MTLLTILFTLISLTGVIFNVFKDRRCFYFWIVSNSCWMTFHLSRHEYDRAFLFLFNLTMSFVGLRNWKREPASSSDQEEDMCIMDHPAGGEKR